MLNAHGREHLTLKIGLNLTKKTSYVVEGADPGSKLAKAERLRTKTINEAEFLKLLDKAGDKL